MRTRRDAAGAISATCLRRLTKSLGIFGVPSGTALALPEGMFRDVAGHEDLTEAIIECAMTVHETFGPGLLEAIYKRCLTHELSRAGFRVDTTRRVPIVYKTLDLGAVYCPDLIVNDLVIVELKAVEKLTGVHTAQVITYLKLTSLPIGLLINFNVALLKGGIRRVVRPDLYRPR